MDLEEKSLVSFASKEFQESQPFVKLQAENTDSHSAQTMSGKE